MAKSSNDRPTHEMDTPNIPRKREDTDRSGDAKNGTGEDNHTQSGQHETREGVGGKTKKD